MKCRAAIISLIILTALSGCLKTAPAANPPSRDVNTDEQSFSFEAGVAANPFSVWDELAARQYEIVSIDSPEDPDLFNLYLEGVSHSDPYVEWYACNKLIAYSEHPEKQKAIDAIEKLLVSTDINVVTAAKFALEVYQHNFNGPAFSRSPDGKRVAFHLFNEARYNDGEVWIYDFEQSTVYPLKGQWLSVEDLKWSGDSNKLSIAYGGRTWGSIDLVDPMTGESLLENSVYDVLEKNKLYTAVKQARPDPYYRLVEWSPDSTKAMMSYSFMDDDNKVQQGIVIYDLRKAAYTTVMPYASGEAPYPEINKPEGFKW
ncbi:hypothetical protein [Paenibacillus radicis (ex Gao et al. 2016)]|uniref:Uncharacterized protein n=1 Tax=Paenibacillus radicis (ex Gao et al. 2016) TaxID=1737354 RepID=A0A917H2R4_9BACL|nr:hypothetical protein [Paenibacillus radicis (ex Gao et al. 2016)]GGG65676.1 hypothetical protein GCM10010918_19970 [Paenibacillus radicis (ex Gao et al. 2016)]